MDASLLLSLREALPPDIYLWINKMDGWSDEDSSDGEFSGPFCYAVTKAAKVQPIPLLRCPG